jgi:hypothetical protein
MRFTERPGVGNMTDYYFIIYKWRRIGDESWCIAEQCIEGYPLDWLLSMRNSDHGDVGYIEYHLLNWKELTPVEYLKYKMKFRTYKQSIQEWG